MAESKRGHNFAILGPTNEKILFHLFFMLMEDELYINFKFLAQAIL